MHDPPDPPRAIALRATGALLIAASLLAIAGPIVGAGSLGNPGRAPPFAGVSVSSSGSPCSGARVASHYRGNVTDAPGGASAPPLANQSILLAYRYTQTFHPQGGGPAQYLCVSTLGNTESGSGGSFSVNATLPTPFCSKPYGCWNFSGPYGPASLSLEGNALPSGYYLNISVSNGSYTLARVLALERVVLSPAGFTTVSVDAPTVVAAAPRSGQGTPSPANLSFAWSISGTGWQVLSSENTSSVTVEPLSTTYVATVEVWANGTYGGATLHAPPVSVLLTAATTAIQTGAVEPTSVDEGVPASFTWSGTGAEGYPYTASLKPGFALPAVGASCSNRSISGGLLEFECTALYTYPERGVAQPFATLSNAYSGANYSFSPITVSATLVIGVTPIPAVEYAGVPIDFAVKVESGSGSAPYGPACLSDGIGHTSCQRTPGQPWMFPVTYPFVGQYRAEATVADSGGANYTDLIPVTIVHSLSLGEITLPRFDFPQGGNVSAYDQVFGGAFPLNYWWNTSTASTVGRGTNGSDGNLSITFPAGSTPGPANLTLTVVDALGTVVHWTVPYHVVATTAVAIDLLRVANASVSAGSPLELSFEAVDVLQEPAAAFSGAFGVIPPSAGLGEVWVNDSWVGSVAPTNGTFELPPTAWSSGYLNLTLAENAVGVFEFNFSAPQGITGPLPFRLTVGPDVRNEILLDPKVVRAGDRSNSTLYQIQDCFGNPISTGDVVVESEFGSTLTNVDSPIHTVGGVAFVWVNFTAVGGDAGVVEVLGTSGGIPLITIVVPAPASPPQDLAAYALLGGLAAAAALIGATILARRRRPDSPEAPVLEGDAAVEEGLKRLAEGRAHVLERVPFDTPVDLDHIAFGWTGPPPDAAELAEWVGSLVSEGALRASIGPEGRPMFLRIREAVAPAPPRVEVDPMALDAALERQRIESHESEAPRGRSDRDEAEGPPD